MATWSTRCGACGTPLTAAQPAAVRTNLPAAVPLAVGGPTMWGGPQRRIPAIRWGGGQDVTRYLCAAAYLDRAYAELLIK
ncbi:hypothetical protein GCM10010300_48980 [Streptomyces olivaceoviridis]|nr:hypothetical protein GCM10010300_48980 [Streptomyces olivaceoviridis]